MIKLKTEVFDGKQYINLHDQIYYIENEARGIRDKFWIKRIPSKFFVDDYKYIHMLFKYNRNDQSCEDWGEVFSSKIAKQIGVNAVDYYLCEVDEDDNFGRRGGVLCGSYFESDRQYEMSVHALQTIYSQFHHNEDTNETNKELNTVYSILDDMRDITPELPEEDEEKMQKKAKTDLLIQCLFDFLLAQTDRHWLNTTFLIYENGDKFFMKKSAAYDNGCIAFLKKKLSAITGMSREIGENPINSIQLNNMMSKYIPMMGIKTSTVKLAPSHTGERGVKLKVDLSKKEKFLDELTDEILNNPEVAIFYTLFKRDFDMDKVVDQIRKDGDNPPPEVIKMISDVIIYQTNQIEMILRKKLANIHAEEREDGR